MKQNDGKIWPYAIAISIALVFGASIVTIVVAGKLPVAKSDEYMMSYQKADANANELIKAQIEFDKKYNIEYITDKISLKDSVIKYKITDKDLKPVDDAKLLLVITRPDSHKYDQKVEKPTVEDGVYSFSPIKLEKEGRWNLILKVNIDNLQRFYNIKTDTRKKEFKEY